VIVVTLTYVVPIAEIDAHRPAHIAWLKAAVDDGRLLIAGRQVPLTGGMLIARGSREEVAAWAATDPFAIHGLAEYGFVEVEPSVVAPGLESVKA
jgi:uncharacterized protein YciI